MIKESNFIPWGLLLGKRITVYSTLRYCLTHSLGFWSIPSFDLFLLLFASLQWRKQVSCLQLRVLLAGGKFTRRLGICCINELIPRSGNQICYLQLWSVNLVNSFMAKFAGSLKQCLFQFVYWWWVLISHFLTLRKGMIGFYQFFPFWGLLSFYSWIHFTI